MKKKYPRLFSYIGMNLNFEDKILFRRGECKPPCRKIIDWLVLCKIKNFITLDQVIRQF
jgi:hypothetical protein